MVCPFGQKGFGDCLASVSIRQLNLTWKGSTISLDTKLAHVVRVLRCPEAVTSAMVAYAICFCSSLMGKIPKQQLVPGCCPVKSIFEAAGPAKLQIGTQTMPLFEIAEAWEEPGKRRIVVTIQ